MFLITGCGRSGTVYISKVLNQAGLDVGHEKLGRDGAVSPLWLVSDRRYPAYHQQGSRPEFDIILHQVRHPLGAIASLTTTAPKSWKWLLKHVPIDPRSHVLQMSAEFWLHWNIKAEDAAVYTYRIENLEWSWEKIKELTGARGCYGDAVAGVPENVNARSHINVTWDMIEDATPLAYQIRGLAEYYGYEL